MEISFDINRISTIRIYDRVKENYEWLPRKQKTYLFGLIKRNSWFKEGYYRGGNYVSSYMGYAFEEKPISRERMIEYGHQIDEDGTVWNKPIVHVYLISKETISRRFETLRDAQEWADELKKINGGNFEIVKNDR
jgi:hypothetical protein